MQPILRRSLLQMAALGPMLALPGAARALQDPIWVSGPAELATALAGATGGETFRLAPGDYGRLVLDTRRVPGADFPRPVTLVSDDPSDPAVLTGVALRGAGNLVFDSLRFNYRFMPGDKIYKRPFDFKFCRSLTIRNSVFDGDVARGVSVEDDGLGWAFGLSVGGGQEIRILNNRVLNFYRGMVFGGARNVVVAGNELVGLRMDGMNFVAMQDVRIEGNHIHGFRRSTLKADHADMIQFWTNGSETPSTGITICGNLLLAGDGDSTQSIFMRNDMVDRALAGPGMFYRDVLIEENVILNGHLHGITLGETKGATIRRNTLLRDPAFATVENRDRNVTIPRILLKGASVEVVLADNIAFAVPGPQPGWQVEGNLLVQDRSRMQPGFYGLLFETRPPVPAADHVAGGHSAELVPLRVILGSAADRPGLGAALMR